MIIDNIMYKNVKSVTAPPQIQYKTNVLTIITLFVITCENSNLYLPTSPHTKKLNN